MAISRKSQQSRRNDGRQLEEDFARWAKRNRSFDSVEFRMLVNGETAARPYEVDIRASIPQEKYERLWKIAIGGGLLSAVAVFGLCADLSHLLDDTMESLVAGTGFSGSLVALVAFVLLGWYAHGRRSIGVWTECKDLKTRVKRDAVMKLVQCVQDVREADADWPDEVWLVSGSGFDQDALALAEREDIICFERSERGFRQVN